MQEDERAAGRDFLGVVVTRVEGGVLVADDVPSTTQRSPLVCCMASLSRIRFLVIRCNFTRVRVFISRPSAVSERLTFL